jgi:DNA-binding MarR family transcriptional regulator
MQLPDPDDKLDDIAAIEGAMVAIRRSYARRTLGRAAERERARSGDSRPSAAPDRAVFDVLDVIEAAEQAGEPTTVSGVAAALNIAQPRASKLVAAAVADGLVRRRADQSDGRRALLVRTAAGRVLSERVHAFRRGVVAAGLADWSAEDRAELARLLTRFVADLARAAGDRAGS